MNLTLSFDPESTGVDREFVPVEVASDISVEDFLAYIEAESSIPPAHQLLVYRGRPVPTAAPADLARPLAALIQGDGDIVVVLDKTKLRDTPQAGTSAASAPPQQPAASSSAASASSANPNNNNAQMAQLYADFERIRNHMLTNPVVRSGVYQEYPQLEDVVHDATRFREEMMLIERRRHENEVKRREAQKKLEDDPYDPEAQALILQSIHEDAIMENFHAAMEHNPESFASVTMLFVDTNVHGHHVRAFVDSGAQATIMSPSCAEQCGIAHLIDTRFQGMAMGVGTARILGRIHNVPIEVGGVFLATSFTVMEGKGVDFLLGLDMLKKHRAVIDLKENVLHIADVSVRFLPEAEIPTSGLFFQDANSESGSSASASASASSASAGPSSAAASSSGIRLGTSTSSARAPAARALPSSTASAPAPAPAAAPVPPAPAAPAAPATAAAPTPPSPSTSSSASAVAATSSAQPLFAAAQPSPRQTSYPEEVVQNLMLLGFERATVLQALDISGGNPEHAAAMLFE